MFLYVRKDFIKKINVNSVIILVKHVFKQIMIIASRAMEWQLLPYFYNQKVVIQTVLPVNMDLLEESKIKVPARIALHSAKLVL